MISARALARSAPRTAGHLSSIAARRSPAFTTPSMLSRSSLLRSQVSTFSTSMFRRSPVGAVDSELSAKLESEIKFESEMKAEDEPKPASIDDFLENGPFEVQDTPGMQDVSLVRTYGNEKITVTFSIAEIANMDQDIYDDEDPALGEDDFDVGKELSEEVESDAETEGEDVDSGEPAVPCRLSIVVEKPGKGALNIEAVAQDSSIIVENMYYYQDASLAHSRTAEAARKSEDVFAGPPFGTLDEDLQVLVERYLEERGITAALAVFVPEYMDMKEQREYLSWLKSVKGFVDA